MTDILKEKIIIRAIKAYKNREEWTDEYVQENYSDAIEYMTENFDRFIKLAKDGAVQSKTQGSRSVTYKSIDNVIQSDFILKGILGLPLIRAW